jgi:hypothetical protein
MSEMDHFHAEAAGRKARGQVVSQVPSAVSRDVQALRVGLKRAAEASTDGSDSVFVHTELPMLYMQAMAHFVPRGKAVAGQSVTARLTAALTVTNVPVLLTSKSHVGEPLRLLKAARVEAESEWMAGRAAGAGSTGPPHVTLVSTSDQPSNEARCGSDKGVSSRHDGWRKQAAEPEDEPPSKSASAATDLVLQVQVVMTGVSGAAPCQTLKVAERMPSDQGDKLPGSGSSGGRHMLSGQDVRTDMLIEYSMATYGNWHYSVLKRPTSPGHRPYNPVFTLPCVPSRGSMCAEGPSVPADEQQGDEPPAAQLMLLQVPNLPESVLRLTGGGSEHTVLRLRGGMESGGQMRAEYLGIEPLNGQNYLRWKGKMKATLVLKGWDDAIDPPTPVASGSTPPLSKNDAKALALIQLCMDESQMVLIRDCKTALEAWQLLEAHYRSSLQQQSVGKLKELSHLMKEQHESIEQYCNRAQKLWNEYLSGGSTYTSHQFLQQLLAGLPKVYDVTVTLLDRTESLTP